MSYIKNHKYVDKCINFPMIIFNQKLGISFSSNGKFMALAERRDAKDYIGIYYCNDWKLVNVEFTSLFFNLLLVVLLN